MPALKLTDEQSDRLATEVTQHLDAITNALLDRRTMWDTYIKQYKAIRDQEEKTFPWPDCSNVFVPELFGQISTVTAHQLGSTIRQDPPFIVESLFGTPEDVQLAGGVQRFLRFFTITVQEQDVYWRKHLPYTILLGTNVCKLFFRAAGALGYPTVEMRHVHLHRFYAYPGVLKMEDQPLIGEVAWVSTDSLIEWMNEGLLSKEKMKALVDQTNIAMAQADLWSNQRIVGSAIPGTMLPIHELYVQSSLGDPYARTKRYRVLFHYGTSTVLWVEDWDKKKLPYEVTRWLPDEDNFFGRGVGDLAWTLQEMVNTGTNQAVDNATLANTRMFIGPPANGIENGDPVYPGRFWISPQSDKVRVFAMGDVYPSAWMIPDLARGAMMRTATGASDALMGMSDTVAKTRATFAGAALNVEQGSTRLDYNSAEFENGLSSIVWHSLEELIAYAKGETIEVPPMKRRAALLNAMLDPSLGVPGDVEALVNAALTGEEAAGVKEVVFRVPENVLSRQRFRITPSRRSMNAQVERQAAMVLSQVVNQYLKQIVELAQLFNNPEVMQATIAQVWNAAAQSMRRVLAAFNVADANTLIVELPEVTGGPSPSGSSPDGASQVGAGGGTSPGPGVGYSATAGLAGLPGGASGILGGRPEGS